MNGVDLDTTMPLLLAQSWVKMTLCMSKLFSCTPATKKCSHALTIWKEIVNTQMTNAIIHMATQLDLMKYKISGMNTNHKDVLP